MEAAVGLPDVLQAMVGGTALILVPYVAARGLTNRMIQRRGTHRRAR